MPIPKRFYELIAELKDPQLLRQWKPLTGGAAYFLSLRSGSVVLQRTKRGMGIVVRDNSADALDALEIAETDPENDILLRIWAGIEEHREEERRARLKAITADVRALRIEQPD